MTEEGICPPLLVRIQSIEIPSLDFQGASGGGTGVSSKSSRHITYVEGTNLFLFVGCTSGTVYVFSRDSLKLLFMIPFKGGKVCHIVASLDESDVAVASIRGKVSIYRISPSVHYNLSRDDTHEDQEGNKIGASPRNSSSTGRDAYHHLFDVPHHVQSEITEMQWSPNGKFLFIGDSQGVISEVDVASFEEFPRPPPSRIILKLQSRILQIDCTFPYMAICTLDSVYLCDLEKEDFTRIKNPQNKKDIRSAGLSLSVLPSSERMSATENNDPGGKMVLFVGEVSTGSMYKCDLDGTVIAYKQIGLSQGAFSNCSVTFFDPKEAPPSPEKDNDRRPSGESELNYSLGKMLTTDDGLLVSVSSDRIFVYDPFTMDIILWNDDFNRIHSFKVVANYGFVWYGNKLDVFAFTQFRNYGEQLFKAGLHSVLQNFVAYAVRSCGWVSGNQKKKSETEQEPDGQVIIRPNNEFESVVARQDCNESAIGVFRKLVSPIEEDDSFCEFIHENVPFQLYSPKPQVIVVESESQKLERVVKKFCFDVEELINSDHSLSSLKDEGEALSEWTNMFLELCDVFYNELGATLPELQCKQSELTLSRAIQSVQSFYRQPQLVNLHEELQSSSLPISVVHRVKDLSRSVLKMFAGYYAKGLLLDLSSDKRSTGAGVPDNPNIKDWGVFTKCSKNPVIQQYFKEIGISPRTIWYDGIFADTIVLLVPLVPEEYFSESLEKNFHLAQDFPKLFFCWLSLSSVFSNCLALPYGTILRNLQNERFFDKLAEEVFLTIFKDALNFLSQQDHCYTNLTGTTGTQSSNNKSSLLSVKYLHHFASYIILYSKSPNLKPRGLNLILQCFPSKRNSKGEIIEKMTQLCSVNSHLYKMIYKACLSDENSLKLCECGIPASYGSLEEITPPYQRAVEEAILSMLVEEYLSLEMSLGDDPPKAIKEEEDGKLLKVIRDFGMRRCLVEASLGVDTSVDELLPDYLKIHLILRTGVCGGLKHLKFNLENVKVLREFTRGDSSAENGTRVGVREFCPFCHHKLTVLEKGGSLRNKVGISRDCLGVWILENCHSLEKFMSVIKKMSMNSPNEFSLSFYRFLIQRDDLRKNKKKDAGFGDLVCLSSLNCSVLH